MKVLTMTCPNCGGKLEVDEDMERFACAYCGTEQLVIRRRGTVRLKSVTDAIGKVQRGTDKTAAELAIPRLETEIAQLKRRRAVIRNKAQGPHLMAVLVGSIVACVQLAILLPILSATESSTGQDISGIGGVTLMVITVVTVFAFIKANRYARARYLATVADQISEIESELERREADFTRQRAVLDS